MSFSSSYIFNGTSSQLSSAAATYVTLPLSMMVDCIPYSAMSSGVLISQLNTAGNWNGHYIICGTATGVNFAQAGTVSNNVFSTGSNAPIAQIGKRQIIGGTWRSTSFRQAWVNGKAGPADTSTSAPTNNQNNTTIWAAHHNNAFDNFGVSAIVFSAWVWNVELDAGDWDLLARGVPATNVRPGSIVEGWVFYSPIENFVPAPRQSTGLLTGINGAIVFTSTNVLAAPIAPPDNPPMGIFGKRQLKMTRLQQGQLVSLNQAPKRAATW